MNKTPFLGVAYYPEAWDRSQIDSDLDSMLEHGISCVRICEFAWKTMEPTEGVFDFSLFREVVDKCRNRGMQVIIGTPGATPPLWLSNKYPDVYGERIDGVKRFHGSRQDCCYSHTEYRHLALRITEKMAEEFADDENVIGWQIDNEIFSSKDELFCVCEKCERRFRDWTSKRFGGDVAAFNRRVGTNIFSSAIDSFEELHRPYKQWIHPEHQSLWRQFQTDLSAEYVREQYAAIKKYTDKPVGTDMMPIFQALSYEQTARDTDVMQVNEYLRDEQYYQMEFWANFLYNTKKKPYWLTETSCCWNGSAQSLYMRHKGFVQMNGWMNIASGAESVNYWLWRTHYAGHELMHGSVVESNGRARHIKKEIIDLSESMDKCADLINGTRPAGSGIAMIASENSERTFTFQAMYDGINYPTLLCDEFAALSRARLRPTALLESSSLDDVKLLYTPYLLSLENNGLSKKILEFVKNGGTWIASAMTDIRTDCEAKFTKYATGVLEEAAKVTIDFTIPGYHNNAKKARAYTAFRPDGTGYISRNIMYDALIPSADVKTVASYTDEEYLNGYAAVTESKYGKGKIVMLGFVPTLKTLTQIVSDYAAELGITPFVQADDNLTVIKREGSSEAIIAIEHEFETATLVAPFPCTDKLTGQHFDEGKTVPVDKYGVRVLVKD